MYTEEPRKEINWGNLFKNILIIVGVVAILFLIFWLLIHSNDSNKINVNTNGTENNSGLNDKYYSSDFIENYRYFHDTAKEYFLVTELPEKGKTIKYTLKELIDMGLILPFGYEQKACETESSYVLVTNVDGDYKLTTTLVCSAEVAKTTEKLGCNQLCTNGNCTTTPEPNVPDTPVDFETVTEYEYRQSYTEDVPSYSCPSGYTLDGDKCYKNNSTTIKATKTSEYTCPNGYVKSGSGANTKCTSTSTSTVPASMTTTYTCPSGYTQSGSGINSQCTKTTTTVKKATATTLYTCPSGYIAVGEGANTRCYTATNVTIAATPSYSCPAGYTQVGTGANATCVKNTSSTYPASYKTTGGNCKSGYTAISDTTCVAYANPTKSCRDGYSLVNGTCQKSISASKTCSSGTYTNGTCQVTTSATKTCSSGTYTNGTCQVSTSATKTTTYTCSDGSKPNSNHVCTIVRKTSTTITSPYAYTTYKGCSYSGYHYNTCGTNCQTRVYDYYCPAGSSYTEDAKVGYNYTCPSGYTKSGSGSSTKCYKNDSSKLTYTCPSGYSKSGSGSSTKCYKNDSSKLTYTCPSGYTKSGSSCIIYDNSKLSTTCPSGYTLSGNSCVKYDERIWEAEAYCPNGGVLDYTESYCVVSNTDIERPIISGYYCADPSYRLSGSTCYKTTEQYIYPSTSTGYKCAEGTLNGSNCNITKTENTTPIKNTSYSCSVGTLNGTVCSVNRTVTQNADITNKYTCPNGYVKYGDEDNTTCTKGVVTSTSADKTTKKVTKYRYQWSQATSLAGWDRTGKTRQVKASTK